MTIASEALAWLHQSATVKGSTYSQVLLHLLERLEAQEAKYETQRLATLEWGKDVDKLMRWIDDHLKRIMALEAAQQQPHQDKPDRLIEQDCEDDDEPQTLHTIALKMVDTLEQMHLLPEILDTLRRAIREPMEQPTPEPALVATDEELLAMRLWSSHGPTIDSDLVDFGRRCYNLAKQPVSTPYKLPAPPPATAGGLVERVALAIGGEGDHPANWTPEARAAIREVAMWLRSELNLSVADLLLEQEADHA